MFMKLALQNCCCEQLIKCCRQQHTAISIDVGLQRPCDFSHDNANFSEVDIYLIHLFHCLMSFLPRRKKPVESFLGSSKYHISCLSRYPCVWCTWLWIGIFSLSDWTSYRKISWSFEAAGLGFGRFQSLCNLTGTDVAALPRCLSNFKIVTIYVDIYVSNIYIYIYR